MEKESENSLEDGSQSKSTVSDWWDFIYNNTAQIANLIQFGEKGDPYSLKADFEGSKKLFDTYSKRLKNNFGESSSDPVNESENTSNERWSYKGSKRSVDTTLYDRLGVSPDASKSEIKSSYRKMALKYHPDKNTSAEAKKKFQEIGEAYQVLVDDLSRQNYDKNGMSKSMGFQEFDIDPSVFFIMLFGCDLLEEFIGPLKLESLLKYDVNLVDLAKSNQFKYDFNFSSSSSSTGTEVAVHRDSVHNYMNTVQAYREARLAVLLRDRIDSFIELKRIPDEFLEFIESACRETYVDLLVTSVGWVYENCADSYISETTSFLGLGATYSNLQSFGRNINNGYNIVKSTFSAFNLFYQNQIKDKNTLENTQGSSDTAGMINMGLSNEKMAEQIEAVLECFLTIVVFDVESTVKQACIKVCNDEDVDQKTRLRRAHVMKRIGMRMQAIAEKVRSEQGKSKIDVSKIVEQAYIKARQKADQVH